MSTKWSSTPQKIFPHLLQGFQRGFDHFVSARHYRVNSVQKIKFSIKDFFSKCDHIRWKLRIWSHLPKKHLIENFFCV